MLMIDRAATSATTRASACWSAVNGPGRSRYRLSAPKRTLADGDREPEHGPSPGIDRRPGERRPTKLHRVRQVGLGDRAALPVGIHTWAFTQRVLQLLDQRADVVRGAQRSLRTVIGEQHDPGAAHLGDLRTHRTEPSRRTTRTTVAQPSQDANHPIVRHHTPPPSTESSTRREFWRALRPLTDEGEAHSGVQIRRVSRMETPSCQTPGALTPSAAAAAICTALGSDIDSGAMPPRPDVSGGASERTAASVAM